MNSPSQHWQSDIYAENARFVADYGTPLIELLNPKADEYILDLGCGDGVLTRKIAEYGSRVLGLDGSRALLETARANGIDAVWGDGQKLAFNQEFDAVFSNAALHWMTDAPVVVQGVARALRSGGRFVGEMGGCGNIAVIRTALSEALSAHGLQPRSCWYFPDAGEYRELLWQHGFTVHHIALYPRPTPLPTGVAGWLKAFGEPMLPEQIDDAVLAAVFARAAESAERQLPSHDGQPVADYVRLRFVAQKTV